MRLTQIPQNYTALTARYRENITSIFALTKQPGFELEYFWVQLRHAVTWVVRNKRV